jgi:hypothetical protein
MRLMYGTPPDPSRWSRSFDPDTFAEEVARKTREHRERLALGTALFNLLAPLTGEEPLP